MKTIRLAGVLLAIGLGWAAGTAALATPAFPKAVRAGPPPADDQDTLADAVASQTRSPANRVRDVWRHPAESLTFWGLRPGDAVLELDPGGGYWAEILTAFTKATEGRYTGMRSADLLAKPPEPASADFVLTGREIHNYIRRGNLDQVLAASFAALKPGGVFAVEEHRADPPPDGRERLGRLRLGGVHHRRGAENRLPGGRALGDQCQSPGFQGPSVRGLDPAAGPAQRSARPAAQPELRPRQV